MKEKIGYVYLTTNLVNGKQYVGQHLSEGFDINYKGSGTYLKNAINKYGWDNFTCEVLQWCSTQTQLNEVEDNCIRLYGTMFPEGYNLKGGGSRGRFSKKARKTCSKAQKRRFENPEERKKLSERGKKRFENPEERRKCSEAQKGRTPWNKGVIYTKEAKENMFKAQKRRFENPEECKKASERAKKRFESEENRKKVSEALKKYFENEENRKKVSEALKKYYESEEGKLSLIKISESQKKRFEDPEERRKMSEAKKNPSEETRKKMSEAKKGVLNNNVSKPVLQFTKDGIFVKEWVSTAEIVRQLGLNYNCINNCCRGIKHHKSYKGFLWRYK